MRIVYTAGVWDQLHYGHLNFLEAASKQGDLFVVGVVSDLGTLRYKQQIPVESAWARMGSLRGLPFVHVVVEQDDTDPTPMLQRFRPAVFCHADGDGDWSSLRAHVAALGIEYMNLPYTPGISSTMLREAVNGRA